VGGGGRGEEEGAPADKILTVLERRPGCGEPLKREAVPAWPKKENDRTGYKVSQKGRRGKEKDGRVATRGGLLTTDQN